MTEVSQGALLPCPFCGGEAQPATIRAADLMIWTVECSDCGAERASDESADEACQLWSVRATPTAEAGLREALPEDWEFWLGDAAQILRSNGTTTHAEKVAAVLKALVEDGGKGAG